MPPQQSKTTGIVWNRVTKLSQLVAILLFVAVFALGFYLGKLAH